MGAMYSRAENHHFFSDDRHKHECEYYMLNMQTNQRIDLVLVRPDGMRTFLHLLPPTVVSLFTPIFIESQNSYS